MLTFFKEPEYPNELVEKINSAENVTADAIHTRHHSITRIHQGWAVKGASTHHIMLEKATEDKTLIILPEEVMIAEFYSGSKKIGEYQYQS